MNATMILEAKERIAYARSQYARDHKAPAYYRRLSAIESAYGLPVREILARALSLGSA